MISYQRHLVTYIDVEISLPIHGQGPKFAKVTKHHWKKSITIGRYHDNTMLYTIIYEVEYLNWDKASIDANIIDENLCSQVD